MKLIFFGALALSLTLPGSTTNAADRGRINSWIKSRIKACTELLLPQNKSPSLPSLPSLEDKTPGLISYLTDIVHRQVIGRAELRRFEDALKAGRLENPISEDDANTNSALLIHREGLQKLLNQDGLDIALLREWVAMVLKKAEQTRSERAQAASDTVSSHLPIEYAPVPGRRFQFTRFRINVTLTHSIEVMTTPLTQMQWAQNFGTNPSHFKSGPDSGFAMINGKQVKMQPDHPVEQISWWSALMAANKLSEANGIRPCYDFTDIKWDPQTRFEDGTLKPLRGRLKINAPNGDIYRATGYRLPTEVEQENLLQLEAQKNGHLAHALRAWDLAEGKNNSGTHSVAQLTPLSLGGHNIFDLTGNILEWSHDSYTENPKGGVDPVQTDSGWDMKLARGSSIDRLGMNPDFTIINIGVRFVRTLR